MKRIFFVTGPESSGTRIVTRLLCLAGCEGDYEHEQRLDKFVYGEESEISDAMKGNEALVFRRSIPHYPEARPDIIEIGNKFRLNGFEPYYILTMRDWGCNAASKKRVGHSLDFQSAKEVLIQEWGYISHMFVKFEKLVYIVLTSGLFRDPKRTINDLGTWLKIKFPPEAEEIIFNADEKYY